MPSREYEKALFILKTSTKQKNQAGESKSAFFGAFEHSGSILKSALLPAN
jgi:hypothetical protein